MDQTALRAVATIVAASIAFVACSGDSTADEIGTDDNTNTTTETTGASLDPGDPLRLPQQLPTAEDGSNPSEADSTTDTPSPTTTTASAAAGSTWTPTDSDISALQTMLLTEDGLGGTWSEVEPDGEQTLPYADNCAFMRPLIADITGATLRQAFSDPNGARIEFDVGVGDPEIVATHFGAWSAEGSHDCVQLAVEELYPENLEGSIIEAEPVPEIVDAFGYRVTVALASETGEDVIMWSSTMMVAREHISLVTVTSPEVLPEDLQDILALAAAAIS
ncbi:MAG: hypothetical protein GY708_29550 [Actinomycetia bacterium]|nr:hypothetical protein [Actinomycetes bacterium]MCP4961151.1 hypothetical protein [Actinomycetes bacterium]